MPFQYKFQRNGQGGKGSTHCTYCPIQPGEICIIACVTNYERIQNERKLDGVIVDDEPPQNEK